MKKQSLNSATVESLSPKANILPSATHSNLFKDMVKHKWAFQSGRENWNPDNIKNPFISDTTPDNPSGTNLVPETSYYYTYDEDAESDSDSDDEDGNNIKKDFVAYFDKRQRDNPSSPKQENEEHPELRAALDSISQEDIQSMRSNKVPRKK